MYSSCHPADHPTTHVRQRAIFYGTYCLSKFTYVASYAVVTQKDISHMQVLVARAVLRRHWIQAQHLPGVLRALKIAPMQDPGIALASAAIGLLERRAKEDDELCAFLQNQDVHCEGDRQLDTALVYLKRYLPTLAPSDARTIQQILTTTAFAHKKHQGPLTQRSRKGHENQPGSMSMQILSRVPLPHQGGLAVDSAEPERNLHSCEALRPVQRARDWRVAPCGQAPAHHTSTVQPKR